MTHRQINKRRLHKIIAMVAATALLNQNVAFALCTTGATFPAGGFRAGVAPLATPNAWSPGIFTGTTQSIFVPDNSTFENNDPHQPLTGGGHNWVFDQGITLCKQTDTGPAGGVATGWAFPPNTPPACIQLPTVNGTTLGALNDVPWQGEVITPTCNPAILSTAAAPNAANTALNQLGCAISHGVATTAKTATSFMFVAGAKGGLFNVPLTNVANPVVGGPAGKVAATPTAVNYYVDIPSGQKLSGATVSPDGRFAIATSQKRQQAVFACLNPLGDPGAPSSPIDPSFIVPSAATVKCMSVGNNALVTDLTTAFGPDSQPYFGGQRIVNTFDGTPGSSPTNPITSAWPQCVTQGTNFTIEEAFANHSANHCGNAAPNGAFTAALVVQPRDLITHGSYMYAAPNGTGSITQMKVTVDPLSGLSQYVFRTYASGFGLVTGLGVADDLKSLMVFVNPANEIPGVAPTNLELVTNVPLCEDF